MSAPIIRRIAYGLLGLGGLILVTSSGLLGALPAFIWIALLFVLGAALWLGTSDAVPLWQRILGFTGLGVVAIISSERFAGAAAVGFPAMAFGLVYMKSPKRWWALIPAGLLGSVALLLIFEGLFPRWDAVPVLFLGFAATFSLLYLLSPKRGGKRWALYPAILFIVLTVLVNDPSGTMPGWFLPLLLIGGGTLMLWWWQRSR